MGTNHYTDIGVFLGMLAILQFGPWAAKQYEKSLRTAAVLDEATNCYCCCVVMLDLLCGVYAAVYLLPVLDRQPNSDAERLNGSAAANNHSLDNVDE